MGLLLSHSQGILEGASHRKCMMKPEVVAKQPQLLRRPVNLSQGVLAVVTVEGRKRDLWPQGLLASSENRGRMMVWLWALRDDPWVKVVLDGPFFRFCSSARTNISDGSNLVTTFYTVHRSQLKENTAALDQILRLEPLTGTMGCKPNDYRYAHSALRSLQTSRAVSSAYEQQLSLKRPPGCVCRCNKPPSSLPILSSRLKEQAYDMSGAPLSDGTFRLMP